MNSSISLPIVYADLTYSLTYPVLTASHFYRRCLHPADSALVRPLLIPPHTAFPDRQYASNGQHRLAACDQLADGIPHCRKLGLILGHDIALSHIAVMKVSGKCLDLPSCLRNCLQRIGEQILVIRLEFHTAVLCKNLVIHLHEIR